MNVQLVSLIIQHLTGSVYRGLYPHQVAGIYAGLILYKAILHIHVLLYLHETPPCVVKKSIVTAFIISNYEVY